MTVSVALDQVRNLYLSDSASLRPSAAQTRYRFGILDREDDDPVADFSTGRIRVTQSSRRRLLDGFSPSTVSHRLGSIARGLLPHAPKTASSASVSVRFQANGNRALPRVATIAPSWFGLIRRTEKEEVECGTEAVNVRPIVDAGRVSGLFGRHIVNAAHNAPSLGNAASRRRPPRC